MFPILNPPPSSLLIPSLWVVPVHQPQASSIVDFYIFECTNMMFLENLQLISRERCLWLFVLVLFLKKYLFVYLAASGLCCVTWVLSLRCMDSLVGAHVRQSRGSVVRAHGLSCSTACGILVPRPGITPTSPALQGRFLTTGPPPEYLHH